MKQYEVVRRRYGDLYAVEYESASVGLTLYVDEDEGKAEAMYRKLDDMTPAQMKDYICCQCQRNGGQKPLCENPCAPLCRPCDAERKEAIS